MKIARLIFACVTSVAVAACGEARLDLDFQIPAAYQDSVMEVVLRLYEPPVGQPFSCDDLALNRVDPGLLNASVLGEVRVRDGVSTPLPEVPRAGNKLFLVEARDIDGRRLLVGCDVLGAIDSTTQLSLPAIATTRVSVVQAPNLSVPLGDPIPRIRLLVTDLLEPAQPQTGVRVLWRLNGPAGLQLEDSITTNSLGEAGFSPTMPSRPGPFALSVEVPWAEQVPPLPGGFVFPQPEEVMVAGQVVDWKPGRLGSLREPGLAALVDEGPNHRVAVLWRNRSNGELQNRRSEQIPTDSPAMGIMKSLIPDTRDRVVVVTTRTWTEINADGGLIPRPGYQPPVAAINRPPVRVLSAGPCAVAEDPARLLVTYAGADAVGFFDEQGVVSGGFAQALDVVSSGCVATDGNDEIRTLVIDGGAAVGLLLAAEVEPAMYTVDPWIAVPSGTDFTPRVGDSPPLLLGTQVSINDFVISRASWSRQGDQVALVPAGVDSPPDLPIDNAGGDIDGDGKLDIVALLEVPTEDQTERYALYASLGAELNGRAIDAVFDLPQLRQPTLHVLDFDGDGVDDILLAERIPNGVGDARLFIYSMGLVGQ